MTRGQSGNRRAAWLMLCGAWAIGASSGAAHARTRTYAIVIAQNQSHDPGVRSLQYADDDGVKTWELLSLFADQVSLFVVPDAETARLHPAAARRAEVPERAAILERLKRYDAIMAADLARGDVPELFFIYAGHGDVDASGQGYIHLHDGRFTRHDLFHEVIGASRARFLHVIIDACKSYFMVNSRGGRKWVDDGVDDGGRSDRQLRAFLENERIVKYPRAGVIVATSGDQETHEWARYRGGILSHELRSALAGAADVNDDGRIEYSELRAFLAAANARVRLPQARIRVFSRPPTANRRRALVDLRQARRRGGTRFLRFGPKLSGRFHVEDDRGVRYADFNKESGSAFDLLVSAGRAYYVRRNELEEIEVRLSAPKRVDIARSAWSPLAVSARGAVETSFRRDLYQVAYGPRFYDGYIARSGDAPVEGNVQSVGLTAARRLRARSALSIGYGFSGPPAGQAGFSHSGELRYAYAATGWLDFGGAVSAGYGTGRGARIGSEQDVTRLAVLSTVGFSYGLAERISARFDLGLGWQLLSGTVEVGGARLNGREGRGLRFEAGLGLTVDLLYNLAMVARGGLALDGVFPVESAAATQLSAIFTTGFVVRW